jgi:hypothetical protein
MLEAEKIKLLKQSVSISHSEMLQAYEIAQLLGVPAIIAPEEADSQCAYLSKNDLVDFVASEDMDLLTFGSKIVVRNFAKKGMLKINLNQILNLGNITMDQFIDICILLGCDYTATIDGIGPKRAWDLIKKYGSLEELIAKDNGIAQAKYKLPDNFRYEESREYFLNPRHVEIDPTNLELKIPKLNELKTIIEPFYFRHPFTCMIAGPTKSGKTSIIKKILNNLAGGLVRPCPECVVYCYSIWQPLYEDIRASWAASAPTGPNLSSYKPEIFFNEGLPSLDNFDASKRVLLILDDLMHACSKDNGILEIFTTNSHHKNISVIYVAQNIFCQGKNSRTISLNYYICGAL